MEFKAFPKIARWSRDVIITEKLDGTNAGIFIGRIGVEMLPENVQDDDLIVDDHVIRAASRSRFIKPGKSTDNHGFAAWVHDHAAELVKLGPGNHFGEWWGRGIQRGYGLQEKRYSLFNVNRWKDDRLTKNYPKWPEKAVQVPDCCTVVPILVIDTLTEDKAAIEPLMREFTEHGSFAAPGFMDPEGIMIYHSAAGVYFKKTFKDDDKGKEAKGVPSSANDNRMGSAWVRENHDSVVHSSGPS